MGLLSSLLEKLDKVELTNQIAITAEKFDAAISGVTVDLWEAMMVWIQVDPVTVTKLSRSELRNILFLKAIPSDLPVDVTVCQCGRREI